MAVKWEPAPDIKSMIQRIVLTLDMEHIDADRIFTLRSYKSTTNAIARIWELSRPWRICLEIEPHYIIEVVSEEFDKLPDEEKEKTIIHELLHIPKKFSGSLVPHNCFGKERVGDRTVNKLHKEFKRQEAELERWIA